jgi:hypothetical protein
MLFEMMTGKIPFISPFIDNIDSNTRTVTELPNTFSKELRDLVDLLLKKDHADSPDINQILRTPIILAELEKIM